MSYNTGERPTQVVVQDREKGFEELQKKSGELRGEIVADEARLVALAKDIESLTAELKRLENAATQEKALLVDTRKRIQDLVSQSETEANNILTKARRDADSLVASVEKNLSIRQEQLKEFEDSLAKKEAELLARSEALDKKALDLDAFAGSISPERADIEKRKSAVSAGEQDLSIRLAAAAQIQKGLENEKVQLTNLRTAFDIEVVSLEEKVRQLDSDRVFLKEEEVRIGRAQEALIAKEKDIEDQLQKMISDRNDLALIEQEIRLQRINVDRREAQVKAREKALTDNIAK